MHLPFLPKLVTADSFEQSQKFFQKFFLEELTIEWRLATMNKCLRERSAKQTRSQEAPNHEKSIV
ncbi:hypothetical protein DP117_32935 [Brasilonema sp. UFV-L1]|nr:hypothetical protein [Brasilonema sp. UFV-L1]